MNPVTIKSLDEIHADFFADRSTVLEEWEMCCPHCREDSGIEIKACEPGTVGLLADGSTYTEADPFGGGIEWTGENFAECTVCGHDGRLFEFQNAGRYLVNGLTGHNCKQAFPDFDSDIRAFLLPGWLDSSYKNDTCPSVYHEETGATIHIDYVDEAKREQPGWTRFTLSLDSDVYADADSIADVFKWLRDPAGSLDAVRAQHEKRESI